MDKKLWIETDYFEDFKCKCGKCKRSCCNSFNISISKKEYYKLITLNCSKKLADKIDTALIEPETISDDTYRVINKNYLGNCPMLDDDGLCLIQKELGQEALALVCKEYPRSLKNVNNVLEANCSNSCEAVVELLLKKDKVSFISKELNDSPSIVVSKDDSIALELFFTNIIQDRSLPINERLKKIVQYFNNNDYKVDKLSSFLEVANYVKTISLNSEIYEEFLEQLEKRYSLNETGLKQYLKDEKEFIKHYPNWEVYFENVLVNHFYFINMPYVDERLSKEECVKGICLLYALLKVILTVTTIDDYSLENLAYNIAGIFHLVEHSSFYYNAKALINNELGLLEVQNT